MTASPLRGVLALYEPLLSRRFEHYTELVLSRAKTKMCRVLHLLTSNSVFYSPEDEQSVWHTGRNAETTAATLLQRNIPPQNEEARSLLDSDNSVN